MPLKTPELTKYTTTSPVVSSFSFTELVNDQGIISFYAGRLVDDDYLSSKDFYSDTIITNSANMGASGPSKRLDVDFDIPITKTLVISGNGVVNAGIGLYRSGTTTSGYIIAKLRKWDGSTETDIVTNQSRTVSSSTTGSLYFYTGTDLTIPETILVKGDTLRLTIELWGTGGSDPSHVSFAHDPKNRNVTGVAGNGNQWDTTGAVPSILKLDLPVKLNV